MGTKAQHLAQALGCEVASPDLYARGFTFEQQVAVALAALDGVPTIHTVVGSSLGGFVAAVVASRRLDRRLRLVLLAPAVNIHALWTHRLGADGLAAWAARGALRYDHAGVGRTIEIPYDAFTQAQAAAEVTVAHPAEILHGLQDDVVPVQVSLDLAARSPGVRRVSLTPDGHRLLASLDVMVEAVRRLGVGG